MAVLPDHIAGLLGIRQSDRPASLFDLIERIEDGLPIAVLDRVSASLAPLDVNFKYHIIARATLARRRKRHKRLSMAESDRVFRLAQVWVLAREVWGTDESARAFLFRPHMMLQGRRPIDVVLGTDMGARLVEDILGRLKYGSAA